MGFEDWGKSKEEAEREKREHEEELARIRRKGNEDVARIHEEMRASNRAHADYRNWLLRTGRTDVPFEDWKAGRYVHVILKKDF